MKLSQNILKKLSASQQMQLEESVVALFQSSIELKRQVLETEVSTIVKMGCIITHALQQGKKILLCGNGGSAADAQHIAAELLVRLRPHVNRRTLPALTLATDMSSITAYGNDYDFESYYERMVEALGQPGDVLIGITTSGKSQNVVKALRVARQKKIIAIGLLGGQGEPALSECDIAIVVPSSITGRIQETHITIGHALMELVEDKLIADGVITCL